MTPSMPVAATTFGFLYRATLEDSLRQIAEAGYHQVELAVGPPHFSLSKTNADERRHLRRALERYGLACVSTNPLELNPVTANPDLFEACSRQYRQSIELSAELGAGSVVMVAGRRSPLIPMPENEAKELLRAQLDRLLPIAQREGVTLTLEAVPYGFIETASQAVAFIGEFAVDDLRLTLDCANVYFAGVDPVEDLRASAHLLKLVHISDSWRNRWAHTQVGCGEIDFAAFARGLQEIRYDGPTVYELVDSEDPAPRLRNDLERLAAWGWAPSQVA